MRNFSLFLLSKVTSSLFSIIKLLCFFQKVVKSTDKGLWLMKNCVPLQDYIAGSFLPSHILEFATYCSGRKLLCPEGWVSFYIAWVGVSGFM